MTREWMLRPKLPGKPSSTCRARCARMRLVKPAMAFCSWIRSGRPALLARGLVIDAQHEPHPGERDHEARAAVAHERQGQSLGRQHPHVDADVDEGLDADPEAETRREQTLEPQVRIRGEARDV